ncbi:MAG: hypoxanthine phosphoribosyltransferase [Acidobacteria bacterium]|nr:hypoxanthine phosphoribosyltransferase [Acidobacteriota bacterium]
MPQRTIITTDQLQKRIADLGRQISHEIPPEEEIIALCVLKGAVFFMTDLVRAMDRDVAIDFLQVSSYGNDMTSSGVVTILKEPQLDLRGKTVLVIEDIVDSGLTMREVDRYIRNKGAARVMTVTLLDKAASRTVDFQPDYVGFQIDPDFVVGYGLDHAESFRNLPEIRVVE